MNWKRGPPVLVGEQVLWSGYNKPESGVIKWIGNIPEKGPGWCVGVELDIALPSLGGDGFWKERKLFECRSKHGILVPIEEIQKFSSKAHSKSISTENSLHFKLDDSQLRDLTLSDLHQKPRKEIKKAHVKNRYSDSESKLIDRSFNNRAYESGSDSKKENSKGGREVFGALNTAQQSKNQDAIKLFNDTEKNSESTINSFTETKVNKNSKIYNELLTNMNEIAGYFKEIKEGDERFEKQEQTNDVLNETNEHGHSKPKKLFSFLKWFNKKHKQEPDLKLFKNSSATSSPIFPRRETSSCESIDTLFSTQTVRSFAYIPPTQYQPSAPPLDYDKSFDEVCEDFASMRKQSEETESIYDRRKKRKAPEPPRLSRENSLPSTLEHKKNDEDFDGVKTFHRRTVSESFKDKKAGSYCHVQGKRKAPPPPTAPLYPNLQKQTNNPYPSLYKKKKPAPPPPESNSECQNSSKKLTEEPKKEKQKDSKDTETKQKDEKGMKVNQTFKETFEKNASLSPLPSRPWYKRSHRDSIGSNIIRKDLLKGFEKKKNKETDDWMPEVGFQRRSLSTESHNKFNIFSKLEKTEDKKKEEKRKSQISILTNISELDREAAEIVRKEQAEENKKMAENDAKYYSQKEKIEEKIHEPNDTSANAQEKSKARSPNTKIKPNRNKPEIESNARNSDRISEPQAVVDHSGTKSAKSGKDQTATELKAKEILKDKENNLNPDSQSNENLRQDSFSPKVLADLTNSSSQSPLGEFSKPIQNSSQARLNFFNVQTKELNYLNEPWVCQKCTLENPGWRVFCEICSSIKPRFPLHNAGPNTKPTEEKTNKSELKKTDKEENVKPVGGKAIETTEPTPQEKEKEKENKEELDTLDELRQKRMNFFSTKSVSQESNQEKPEPTASESRTKLNKLLKEMKSLSVDFEENNNEEDTNKELDMGNKEVKQRRIKTNHEEVNKKEKAEPEKENVIEQKEKGSHALSKEAAVSIAEKGNEIPGKNKTEQIKNDEKVIEAYVVTKTVVLEDIIVKKADKKEKVSASVQTKSSISPTSETNNMKPPPRTKRTASVFEPEPSNKSLQEAKNYKQEDLEELTTRLTKAEGLADFRAKIEKMPLNTEMNTVAVNRLLRKLEAAINCGDHFLAAGLAKELALMKINCSVTRQVTASPSTSKITIDLYIEDKLSHQGPIALELSPTTSLLQLKNKMHKEFGIPLEVQRWIFGKKLATDDHTTLESEGVKSNYSSIFLYLVEPEKPNTEDPAKVEKNRESQNDSIPLSTHQPTHPKGKGWYYNFEEDHYSYCESSEDDLNETDLNDKTEKITEKEETKLPETNLKKTEQETKKQEKNSLFDLNSREAENEAAKVLKYIPTNSVKQKVEELNKTFAENAKAVKPSLRFSQSPETRKSEINSPGRLNYLSGDARKVVAGPSNTKIYNEKSKESFKKENTNVVAKPDNVHYKTLVELQDADLVPNNEPFNCSVCLTDFDVGEGVTLKDCLHTFCRPCLIGTVQYSEDAEVKCPYIDETYGCQSVLQQREIKALVPREIFEVHLAKSVKEAENKIENAFHCKTPDCKGWCIYEDNVNQFRCPVCKSTNCLTCQAIHKGMNCKEYQEKMKDASETDIDAKKTRDMLNEMVEKGEAMVCPKCQVVLMKKWGCDWLKCSMCKTEICWVTRGFRWGPEGKGDTSGGCKCGVNGVKCHPKCNYCH